MCLPVISTAIFMREGVKTRKFMSLKAKRRNLPFAMAKQCIVVDTAPRVQQKASWIGDLETIMVHTESL